MNVGFILAYEIFLIMILRSINAFNYIIISQQYTLECIINVLPTFNLQPHKMSYHTYSNYELIN